MSRNTVLELSSDGLQFEGHYSQDKLHCLTEKDFYKELSRINEAYGRPFKGQRSSRLRRGIPIILIPLGFLMVVLSFQTEAWPFVLSGGIVAMAGCVGGSMFRSRLGLVFCIIGMCLMAAPLGDSEDGLPWVMITIGGFMCVLGTLGMMALALSDSRDSAFRATIIFLPIGIMMIVVPEADIDYSWIFFVGGICFIVIGVLGLLTTLGSSDSNVHEALRNLRIAIDQLNSRYSNELKWTLLEGTPLRLHTTRSGIKTCEPGSVQIELEPLSGAQSNNDQGSKQQSEVAVDKN